MAQEIIGRPYSEVAALDISWGTAYPLIDPDTMDVIGIVDANYPDDPEEYEVVDVVDGEIVRDPSACDAAVLLSDLVDADEEGS